MKRDSESDSPAHKLTRRGPSWRALAGPVATLVQAGVFFWLDLLGVHIPNPVLFFANAIVFSAFYGGMGSGLASAAVTLCFALAYWSAPGQPFSYVPRDMERLIVLTLTMPPLALLVGWLRGAYDAKSRDLERQNAQLVAELRRRSALEEKQRDIEHIMRHDLRSPLTGVISLPEIIMEEDNITDEQRELLSLVANAGRRMLKQINNSLELRKIEEGCYQPVPQPCDPAAMILENIALMSHGLDGGGTNFQLNECGGLTLYTDRLLLDIIMTNLLQNAADACDGCPVTVELGREEDCCVIRIANSRPVPEELRDRFFEKYATAGKSGGAGLGTYSASIMARALGGDIAMESSDESGTRVTLRIPLRIPQRAPQRAPLASPLQAS